LALRRHQAINMLHLKQHRISIWNHHEHQQHKSSRWHNPAADDKIWNLRTCIGHLNSSTFISGHNDVICPGGLEAAFNSECLYDGLWLLNSVSFATLQARVLGWLACMLSAATQREAYPWWRCAKLIIPISLPSIWSSSSRVSTSSGSRITMWGASWMWRPPPLSEPPVIGDLHHVVGTRQNSISSWVGRGLAGIFKIFDIGETARVHHADGLQNQTSLAVQSVGDMPKRQ
jgi:hypothetical protein